MKITTMKKLISLFLACLMLVSLGSLTTAAESDVKVDIVSKNVHFGENYHPMFAVSTENLPDGAEVQLVLTLGNETVSTVKTVETVHGADCDVFTATKGVPAQNIDRLYVAKAQVVSGGEVIAESAVYSYSILEYLNERLYVSANVTAEQKDLYEKFLAFAAAAEAVVGGTNNIAASVYVYNTTGTVDGTNAGGMYKANDVINSLTSNVTVEDGKELTWTIQAYDAAGTALAPITVADAELEGYTVVEGAKRVEFTSFTREVGTKDPVWKLVTDASQLTVGAEIVIVAKDSDVAMSTTQNSNNRGQATVTKGDDNTVAFGDEVQVITLVEGTAANSFAFSVGENSYLYAASTSSKNYLRTQSSIDDRASWTIEIAANGTATVKAVTTEVTRTLLQYNKSSGLYACYGSAQADICIYVKTLE